MNNKCKKVLALVAAGIMASSMATLAGCTKTYYTGNKLANTPAKEAEVIDNGGFAVQKGEYIYFINGMEDYTASNEYGKVVKGALMRVPANNVKAEKAETVVPMLFVSQNYEAGIYIYGDYVYYATPTTDKNMSGNVENTWIDFKCAKIDGSWTMKDYYFRLSNNSAKYRFVEENGVVYCLYEEDGALKSFNTNTRKTVTLVKNAKSEFFYNESDPTDGNVYYTMSVTTGVDTDHASTASYDQLYCVNAAATVSKTDASKASYTVKDGATYDFEESYLKQKNKEAKNNKLDEPYNLSDYSTYPYVNLGSLVLDGIGKNSHGQATTQFNRVETLDNAATPDGYNYTIVGYENDGLYFTRTEVTKTTSTGENTNLYYLADAKTAESGWNTVTGNEGLDVVVNETTNTGSAILYMEGGKHHYLYVDGANDIVRETYDAATGTKTSVQFRASVSGATLWKISGDYLYFWQSAEGGNGNSLQRINYKGTQDDYNKAMSFLNDNKEYQPLQIKGVDWNSSWYKPEMFGDVLLYSNEQSFGSVSYNYIYAANLGTTAQIVENNEAYEAVEEYIDEYAEISADVQDAMRYYFRSGETDAFEAVRKLYDGKTDNDKTEADEFDAFVKKFTDGELKLESSFIWQVSKMTKADENAIEDSWADMLLSEKVEEKEDEGLPTWAIILIVVGGVLIVTAAVLVPLLIISDKKKKAAEADATVNAYKRKIDTTDDKTIDVYADENGGEDDEDEEETAQPTEQATPVEETTEEAQPVETENAPETAEEAVPETENAPVEETAPETAEETPAEVEEDQPVETENAPETAEEAAPETENVPVEEEAKKDE